MKKILALVDNDKWCWTRSTENLAHCMPEYLWEIKTKNEWEKSKYKTDADLVYMRGYCYFYLPKHSRLTAPYIWTCGTGGANLGFRLDAADKLCKQSPLIVQNRSAYHEAVKRGYSSVYIIPNGVETELFKPSDCKRGFVVGFAGNNFGSRAELKGTDVLMDAVRGYDYREVNSENPIREQEMPNFYQSLSVYAQPSEAEGCSNSVMEAMSCGLPCLICEGVGYHGEVCRDGIHHVDGNVVFVERNAQSIKDALDILESNPYIYNRISQNARKFAENHKWRNIANRFRIAFNTLPGCESALPAFELPALQEQPKDADPIEFHAEPEPEEVQEDVVFVEILKPFIANNKRYHSGMTCAIPTDLYEIIKSKCKVI